MSQIFTVQQSWDNMMRYKLILP